MSPPKLVTPIRTYEELDGAQGREVFFRPQRYRAPDLLPVRGEVLVSLGNATVTCALHDVSQNGVAFEWPAGKPTLNIGEHLPVVAVRFDGHEAYRGEAHVGSVRDEGGAKVVGASFEGMLLQVDEILHLRSIKLFAESRATVQPLWRAAGHERFKVLVAELQLYLQDAEEQLGRLEEQLPWHVLHGDSNAPSPARTALIEQIRSGFARDVVRMTEEIDAALRSAPPAHNAALMQWSRRHLHDYFMQAPSARRAFQKPFGYAGDYEVMRFIYELPFEGQTLFGKSICLMFNETRASRAVHHRKDLVKRRMRQLIESRRRPLRILSIAAGPAQELFELLQEIEEIPEPLEIVLFEQDKGALAYAYRRLKPIVDRRWPEDVKLVYLHESIKRLLRDSQLFTPLGPFDMIYSVGLFDYLRPATSVQLARTFESQLAEGGSALIGNMCPENPSRWFMEHHLEWNLIYRSHAELLEIGARAAPRARLQILEEESGVNPFVEISKG
ncbi:MAG TPA: PilZ domain-containing protein [Myxococcales bacterium]|nr:PilZ domain-containing protein [Myxococcales bacterium]